MLQSNPLCFQNSDLSVRWIQGATVLEVGGDAVLLDAPLDAIPALIQDGVVARIRTVAFSSGATSALGGFIPLLEAMCRHHLPEFPFVFWGPMGEERPGLMIEAWSRGWPGRLSLGLDTILPGSRFEMGPFDVKTVGLEIGEPIWQPTPHVKAGQGLGWRFTYGQTTIVWVRTCTPSDALAHFCKDTTLAIIEVGVQPWPNTDRRWRLSVSDASQYGLSAQELWLVGDEGGPLNVGLLS